MEKGQTVYYVGGMGKAYVKKGEYCGEFKKGCKVVDRLNFDQWEYVDRDSLFTEHQEATKRAIALMNEEIARLQKQIDKLSQ